ncbi:DegT/DnrJ/EryC1/StrS family aminotransferase [Bosea sp. NBC_00550]|uniref:DegT/DnrJ/EryC1/StrS family aminotransferase n=1 Tax=Bosea sp. NBC_00550 TaxID=2969621 RepID=UPI0022303A21|nr:DegT/DnrJ/EryC1/StrS family aminotransferase [Bosea sp. NBC_00550]UZF94944.1 DegT/DnrJ/EryC1/StrS family aminotransferase [Bosea sp. NBC_00550]UZF95408.1 DegT/DnrJ/EryC1/StrS family aminotransferase [Bosea sp. NBC_00550]
MLDAMREAAGHFVDMTELQTRASAIIARHTGAEAGIVTGGAAAALTLATAACLARFDVRIMERLPAIDDEPNEVIMFRAHRNAYDHAIRAAGARIVDVGFNDIAIGSGVRGLEAWEIESAITSRTVAVAFTAGPPGQASLAMVCRTAAQHGLPVIVDAAAQLPPKENLRRFIDEGAALVAISGGKALRGPQGTGLLCGRRDLVASALIQQLDMDISPATWSPAEGLIPDELRRRPPHHGIGRGFKVDKESIVGLLTALELFETRDLASETEAMIRELTAVSEALAGSQHVSCEVVTGRHYPGLKLSFGTTCGGPDALTVSSELQRLAKPIHLSERWASNNILFVDPAGLRAGDGAAIGRAVRALVPGG